MEKDRFNRPSHTRTYTEEQEKKYQENLERIKRIKRQHQMDCYDDGCPEPTKKQIDNVLKHGYRTWK